MEPPLRLFIVGGDVKTAAGQKPDLGRSVIPRRKPRYFNLSPVDRMKARRRKALPILARPLRSPG